MYRISLGLVGLILSLLVVARNFDLLPDPDAAAVERRRAVCEGVAVECALAAQRYPHLRAITFDLPAVEPIAKRTIAAMSVDDRVTTVSGDFFVDDLPDTDVFVMGNVLHDWDEDQKQTLITKAYASLNNGGRLIAIENVIDDARRENSFGLLMSLNMLIETPGGSDYTGAQFDGWCRGAGFIRTEIVPLAGPTSAAIAYK